MFSSLSRRRVIVLVVVTCLLLITLDRRGNPIIDRVRALFATAMVPFDTATEAVALPVERVWDGILHVDELQRENEALRDQIEHMKGTDIEARSAVLEYRELLKLNQLTSKFQFDTVEAQVVGESPSNFQNTIEINVGSRQGVAAGMPVTDGAGLIGRIGAAMVGVAWSLVTFLVMPVMVIEGLGAVAAVKRSGSLFKQAWGEQVIGNGAIGIVGFLGMLCGLPLLLLVATGIGVLQVLGVALFVIWVAFLSCMIATLSGIFQTALYHYAANGMPPAAFADADLAGTFRPRR